MKKFLPYILILVALVGFFSSISQARAQEASGSCSYYIPGIEGEKKKMSTEAECGVLSGKWIGLGTCTVKFVFKEDQVTKDQPESECRKIPGKWVQNTTTPVAPTPDQKINTDTTYTPLAPLPGFIGEDGKAKPFETDPTKNPCAFGKYMDIMINLLIGIAAVLAVLMIVIGGLEYMTSELISSKEQGKDRITNAILGLVIALGSWALLNTLNPELLNVCLKLPEARITIRDEQIKQYSGQGTCEPITDPSSLCSPDKLAAAGFASGEQASSICKGESGGNPSLASGVDVCSDGKPFSFGLFQVNVIAHADELPGGICSGIFQVNGGGTQGACMPGKSKNGICFERDCKVINPTKYQSCVSYVTNPINNIAYAANLRATRNWGQWGAYNSCRSKFPAN